MNETHGLAVVERREVARFEPNDEQRRMIRATYANGASDDEFQVLMEIAKARNLNPLLRQIHFVKRWTPSGDVWAPQVSIDGMRAIAERTGLYAGQDKPVFAESADGAIVCCEVAVYRRDWPRPAVGVAYWREYVQTTRDRATGKDRPAAMWAKMPHVMLAKCAESIALRKAFPEDAGGLYTDDEMAQATVVDVELEPDAKPSLRLGAANPASPSGPPIAGPLDAFHAALPGIAGVDAGVVLWVAHRVALHAAPEDARDAAWRALVDRVCEVTKGKPSATKQLLKGALAAHAKAARERQPGEDDDQPDPTSPAGGAGGPAKSNSNGTARGAAVATAAQGGPAGLAVPVVLPDWMASREDVRAYLEAKGTRTEVENCVRKWGRYSPDLCELAGWRLYAITPANQFGYRPALRLHQLDVAAWAEAGPKKQAAATLPTASRLPRAS